MDFFNPEHIINYGGLTLVLLVVFAETGLFFGFFFPGDSLLFVAGLLSGSDRLDIRIGVLILLLIGAAVAGSTAGYLSGRWAGGYLRNRPDGLLFKRKYLDITEKFYQRYGAMAFILGRFLPVIRTFVTILAGLTSITFGKFTIYNIVGASIWVTSLTLAGYWLGNRLPGIADYLEWIVAGMIIITAIPVWRLWRTESRRLG